MNAEEFGKYTDWEKKNWFNWVEGKIEERKDDGIMFDILEETETTDKGIIFIPKSTIVKGKALPNGRVKLLVQNWIFTKILPVLI